jgi:ethanolamine permease
MPAEPNSYTQVTADYFAKRGLRRYAGVTSGAMLSYLLQAVSFIVLRMRRPRLARPYRSPLGGVGAIVTLAIATVTLAFQLADPMFATGVTWVGVWFTLGIIWFALVGQNHLVLAPEEAFAIAASESD